jgi:nitroreductase
MYTALLPHRSEGAEVPLHPLLAGRWSPRAWDRDHALDDAALRRLLEAVRWTPSASNSQPWRLGVARRDEPAFDALADALAPGNRHWATGASALVLLAAAVTDADGAARPWAAYDVGQAAAHLSVQAHADGLFVHQMGGFDTDAAARVFDLPEGVTPLVVVAIGWRSDDVELPEPFAAHETAARSRLPLSELVLAAAPEVRTAEPLPLSA